MFQFETDQGQGYRAQLPCPWNSGVSPGNNNTFPMHQSHSNPMHCQQEPILQIGYNQFMHEEGPSVQRSMVGESSMQGWVNL
ncbi:hypothetical protein Hanom_Chr04g00283851 [Helianthus anomalus]